MSTEREIDRTKQKVPRRCCAIAMAMGAEKLGGVRTRANFSTQNSLLSVGGKILKRNASSVRKQIATKLHHGYSGPKERKVASESGLLRWN
ncbi:hypothetical protein RUM44_009307 [Polyplax serrata]|uniref:Uncharacterized protein n=1 Tax=Polyplax serrata TaxID=468196 RepID=A0ABR1ASB5_POLSC